MTEVENAFAAAVARLRRPAATKLFNPGAARFLARWLARHRGAPSVRRARLFFGASMDVALPEIISEQIFTYGFFDEAVTWLALKSVQPGDTVLDVGAHFGYFTLLFRHLAGTEGRVTAFEPTPSTFQMLRRNAGRRAGLTIENLAVGRQEGTATIADFGPVYSAWNTLAAESRMPGGLAQHQAVKVQVPVVTLDDYVRHHGLRPDIIKIDTENFEFEVVSGASHVLDSFRPRVIMETGSDAALRAGQMLENIGYAAHVSAGIGQLERWDGPLKAANERHKDILFLPAMPRNSVC